MGGFDDYTLAGEPAVGPTGAVSWATHRPSGRAVAVTELAADVASEEAFVGRLRSTVAALTTVGHLNVLPVREVVEGPAGEVWVVEDWVDGRELGDVLTDGPLTPEQSVAIACGALRGLVAVHALGVVHGEVSPATIVVGNGGVPLLIGFGFAGMPGRPPADARADVLTVAGVLRDLLAGGPPGATHKKLDTALGRATPDAGRAPVLSGEGGPFRLREEVGVGNDPRPPRRRPARPTAPGRDAAARRPYPSRPASSRSTRPRCRRRSSQRPRSRSWRRSSRTRSTPGPSHRPATRRRIAPSRHQSDPHQPRSIDDAARADAPVAPAPATAPTPISTPAPVPTAASSRWGDKAPTLSDLSGAVDGQPSRPGRPSPRQGMVRNLTGVILILLGAGAATAVERMQADPDRSVEVIDAPVTTAGPTPAEIASADVAGTWAMKLTVVESTGFFGTQVGNSVDKTYTITSDCSRSPCAYTLVVSGQTGEFGLSQGCRGLRPQRVGPQRLRRPAHRRSPGAERWRGDGAGPPATLGGDPHAPRRLGGNRPDGLDRDHLRHQPPGVRPGSGGAAVDRPRHPPVTATTP